METRALRQTKTVLASVDVTLFLSDLTTQSGEQAELSWRSRHADWPNQTKGEIPFRSGQRKSDVELSLAIQSIGQSGRFLPFLQRRNQGRVSTLHVLQFSLIKKPSVSVSSQESHELILQSPTSRFIPIPLFSLSFGLKVCYIY